jgi:ribosomal protein S5
MKKVLHVRKVSRTNSGGKVRSTSVLVIVGNQNGLAGYGMGKSSDYISAIQKATNQAIKNLRPVLRFENRTIYSDMNYNKYGVDLRLKTAFPGNIFLNSGSGVIANNHIHEICRCAGISDLIAKVYGSRNPMSVTKAAFEALYLQKKPEDIARMRGKKVVDVEREYYGTSIYK